MRTSIDVELVPFTVPNFVTAKKNNNLDNDKISIRVEDLSVEALDALCNQFRSDLFRKANRSLIR